MKKISGIYLIEDFGMEPYSKELSPRYKPKNPNSFTVVLAQSKGPLYFGNSARESSCNCVFTYSVGNVQQISKPPAIPPVKLNFEVVMIMEKYYFPWCKYLISRIIKISD